MSHVALITGFGPFPGVADNPSARLVRALDGRRVNGVVLRGAILPVSYRRGPAQTVALARSLGAAWVLGFGVRGSSERIAVERIGRVGEACSVPDVDGVTAPCLEGPVQVPASIDVPALARALGAEISDNAGAYVCNAWLHQVAQHLAVPVGFVHVPRQGADPTQVLGAVAHCS